MILRSNIDFIARLVEDDAPFHQIVAAIAETIFALEELSRNVDLSPESEAEFSQAALDLAVCLGRMNDFFPELKVEGNVRFVEQAVQREQPADTLLFFLARTLDAVRAPLSFRQDPEEVHARCRSLALDMRDAVATMARLF